MTRQKPQPDKCTDSLFYTSDLFYTIFCLFLLFSSLQVHPPACHPWACRAPLIHEPSLSGPLDHNPASSDWSSWKRSSSFLIAHQSVWLGSLFLIIVSMCVLLCLCLYIVLFLHFSSSTLFSHWQGPWADDLVGVTHTLTCPHQIVQVMRFGSDHCLLCNLAERFVSLYVIVYGFLFYLFSIIILEKVLDEKFLKMQMLCLSTYCCRDHLDISCEDFTIESIVKWIN